MFILFFSKEEKVTTRRKVILCIIGIIAFIYLGVYTVLTPFIRGVVVDETTKQPVENAWVMATATIGTRTIAGDTGGTFLISRPHLRTGKNGVFYIFPKLYLSIPTPYTFGNIKKNLNITLRIMDGKRGEANLTKNWWKKFLFEVISVKFVDRKEDDIYKELASLRGYCTAGGFGLLQVNRSDRCDNWELEYTIVEHERALKKISQPKDVFESIAYSGILRALSRLYQQKSDYVKALEYVIAARDFDLQQKLNSSLHNYDFKINEFQNKLGYK